MAYAYTDLAASTPGPCRARCGETFGWSRDDYWFPDVRSLPRRGDDVRRSRSIPYVYLLARTAFVERPASLIEAARTLGLDARRAFWRVDLPLARPAIAGGIALALMETLADYGTVAYFAVDTFTTGIYRAWFSLGDRAARRNSPRPCSPSSSSRALERWSRGAARSARGNRCAPEAAGRSPRSADGVARRVAASARRRS